MRIKKFEFNKDFVYEQLVNDRFYDFFREKHKDNIKKRLYDNIHASIFDFEGDDEL